MAVPADAVTAELAHLFALRTVAQTEGPARTAAVYINPQTREGVLYCKGLKGLEGEFRLVLIDESGKVASVLARFESKGEAEFKSLEADRIRELSPGMKMAITVGDTPADAAKPLMVSTL